MTTISGFSGDALQAYSLLGVSYIFAKVLFSCLIKHFTRQYTKDTQKITRKSLVTDDEGNKRVKEETISKIIYGDTEVIPLSGEKYLSFLVEVGNLSIHFSSCPVSTSL